ncbi:MAG: hypothetical protein P794_07190 [Epsilonproteobacteria bacterium (ex Lamellibrachia satsuma)]|nr:MAG: hypothetical protein P794_07190 [Epsilonproteobacteria bacterium (ex Lamellibrachia satsuma)]
MQKQWSSFRITLLLYIVILILPFSFYFVYNSFRTIQNDTKIIHQTASMSGAMQMLVLDTGKNNTAFKIREIDRSMQNISAWVKQNDRSDLYIGAASLSKDFSQIRKCWNDHKKMLFTQDAKILGDTTLQCLEKIDTFSIVVEKMVYLKQDRMINFFYISLAIAMALVLLMIYLVRVYIHAQMKKHAIHNHETKLFNQKYFLAELESTCSRAVRHKYPLSILSIAVINLDTIENTHDKETKKHLFKIMGSLLLSLTRTSDIACRYDENSFYILLPFTEQKDALVLEERVQKAFEEHDLIAATELKFKFSTTQFNNEETPEAFVSRTQNLLDS